MKQDLDTPAEQLLLHVSQSRGREASTPAVSQQWTPNSVEGIIGHVVYVRPSVQGGWWCCPQQWPRRNQGDSGSSARREVSAAWKWKSHQGRVTSTGDNCVSRQSPCWWNKSYRPELVAFLWNFILHRPCPERLVKMANKSLWWLCRKGYPGGILRRRLGTNQETWCGCTCETTTESNLRPWNWR